MSKESATKTLEQLQQLVEDFSIQIEHTDVPTKFELTVYYREGTSLTHTHVGGATLAEAINRAHTKFVGVPTGSEGGNE